MIRLLFAMSLLLVPLGCDNADSVPYGDSPDAEAHGRGAHDHPEKDHPKIGPGGGPVVLVGHTHSSDGDTWYYAELTPVTGTEVTWRSFVETENGLEPSEPDADELIGYIRATDQNLDSAREITFVRNSEDAAQFTATIPETLQDRDAWRVVVPKMPIGSQQTQFFFGIERQELNQSEPETDNDPMPNKKPMPEENPMLEDSPETDSDGEE